MPRLSTLTAVFEHGFDPLGKAFDAGLPANKVFSQWISVLPTDQIVAVIYEPTNPLDGIDCMSQRGINIVVVHLQPRLSPKPTSSRGHEIDSTGSHAVPAN